MSRKVKAISICLLAAAVLLTATASWGQDKTAFPKMMTWTSYDVGSTGYLMVGHVAAAIYEKYGIKIRIIPAGSDIPRVYPIRLKDAQVAFHGLGGYFMQEGIEDYASAEWGPQPVRTLYLTQHPGFTQAVRGDSPIKTAHDLKGARVARYPYNVGNMSAGEHLAFAGLTWDDVKPVMASGFTPAMKMVMNQKVDAAIFTPTASKSFEADSMPYGLRYIPLPFSNVEGWKRLKAEYPFAVQLRTTVGAGLGEGKEPLETVSHPYPVAIAYDHLDADTAYAVTKLLVEMYPAYAKRSPGLKAFWTPQGNMDLFEQYPVPMHAGSIKYLKEAGFWKPKHDKLQAERLAHQKKVKAAFDEALNEALDKKMKMDKFPEYWQQKRKDLKL